MKARTKRLIYAAGGLACVAVAAGLVLTAFQKNLVFFFTPTQVSAKEAPIGKTFRIGGLVKSGSLRRDPDGMGAHFVVTDTAKEITVAYRGTLPDLFREGKGVVTQGRLDANGEFRADEVLAKHDENYMPPDAKHAIDQAQKASQTVVKP